MCGGDEWWSETLWCDTKVMWFDWTGGGELIDSERLGVEAQQVCVGWRGPSRRFIRCCTSLIFSLNLVWLWKGGREEVPVAFCTASEEGGETRKEGEKRRRETFAGLSGIISQPPSDLRRTVLSPLLPPPNASSHPFTLISTTLSALPPSSSSHLPPLLLLGQHYLARLIVM